MVPVSAELVDGVNHVLPDVRVRGGPYIGLLIAPFGLQKKAASQKTEIG